MVNFGFEEEGVKMKNDFPRLRVSPELQRKMLETARQFRKEPTKARQSFGRLCAVKSWMVLNFDGNSQLATLLLIFIIQFFALLLK